MTHSKTKAAMTTADHKSMTSLAVALTVLILAGCETTTPTPSGPITAPTEVDTAPTTDPIEPTPSLPISQYAAQFATADLQLQQFDWMSAQLTLEPITRDAHSDSDLRYLAYMDARIQYLRGDIIGSRSGISELLQQPVQPALRRRALNFQRYADRLARRFLESARAGDRLLRTTSPGPEADALKREIWHDLQSLEPDQWDHEDDTGIDAQWLAWLELAKICALPSSPTQRRLAVRAWRDDNPIHPAAETLPGGLDFLLDSVPPTSRVTLLMPLSGKLGAISQAIVDGFLASYYTSRESGGEHFDIDIIDILTYPSATAAYQHAVSAGATMVVGPLGKPAVKELGELDYRPVPILALNRTDTTLYTSGTALVQLALSPEDEAAQIASVAYGRGARSALVLRPATSWGDKMYRAFSDRWTALGGTLASEGAYNGQQDYSQIVSNSLGLPASEERAKRIRRMLGNELEFTPRRRQDIDAVFLLAKKPAEARSIKPLLAYHYAAEIPVYSTSSLYSGMPNARDKDLNGTTVIEIPWLINTDPTTADIKAHFPHDRYARLHALGADAFTVQTQFALLQAGQDALLRGHTGLLTLSPELQLHRELPTATFDRGLLVAD